jgi:hypothetical protein
MCFMDGVIVFCGSRTEVGVAIKLILDVDFNLYVVELIVDVELKVLWSCMNFMCLSLNLYDLVYFW